MLTLHATKANADRAAIEYLTEVFLASGGQVKAVPGFTTVLHKAPPQRRQVVVVHKPNDIAVPRPKAANPVWKRAHEVLLLIREYGLNQGSLAKMLMIERSTLSSYLNQLTRPTPEAAKRIEAAVELMIAAKKPESGRGMGRG